MIAVHFHQFVYGVIAAVVAMMLLDCYKKGWRFVVQSWLHYLFVFVGGMVLLVFAVVLLMLFAR